MKIAIIGTGISGLGAAYLLHPYHDITLFDQQNYPGGHSRTVMVPTSNGLVAVDTGFIVFNYRNYPHLGRLFKHLDIKVAPSRMSFGVSINQGWLEYSTENIFHLVAQKRNLMRPVFWQMLRDIIYFNNHARQFLDAPSDLSIKQYLNQLGVGPWFKHYYFLAMARAIWSASYQDILSFPAFTLLRFFDNHGLLTLHHQPQWYTVCGGSKTYVERLIQPFANNIHLSCAIKTIRRHNQGITLIDQRGKTHQFDHVIVACAADQALHLLEAPDTQEKEILSAFRYQTNHMVLHSDPRFMPKRQKAWASWVYLHQGNSLTNSFNPALSDKVCLSYWMNHLQPLPTSDPIFVTLNPHITPDPSVTYDQHSFRHPQFDTPAIAAQTHLSQIQGRGHVWYCGAWQRYGFHEDGLLSAVKLAQLFDITPPWL